MASNSKFVQYYGLIVLICLSKIRGACVCLEIRGHIGVGIHMKCAPGLSAIFIHAHILVRCHSASGMLRVAGSLLGTVELEIAVQALFRAAWRHEIATRSRMALRNRRSESPGAWKSLRKFSSEPQCRVALHLVSRHQKRNR